jgi:hypothetical protein
MTETGRPRRGSVIGPLVLIVLGLLILAANFYPNFDLWEIFARYWPLILIFIGVGRIWDTYWARSHHDQGNSGVSGTAVGLIALLAVFAILIWHGRRWGGGGWKSGWHDGPLGEVHDTQAIELQGAKSVSTNLEMPAGRLTIEGGSSRLLDADFRYDPGAGKPEVNYTVSGDHGQLTLTQNQNRVHFGRSLNDWNLRFGGVVPLDMNLEMGAGQSNLRLSDIPMNRLKIEMGAGELNLDLTGDRKNDLDADIHGGAGRAMIRLPKNVGVRVHATGGIGSVNARGLHREGDEYENDAYGKTPTTIGMNIEGGVGEIDLIAE